MPRRGLRSRGPPHPDTSLKMPSPGRLVRPCNNNPIPSHAHTHAPYPCRYLRKVHWTDLSLAFCLCLCLLCLPAIILPPSTPCLLPHPLLSSISSTELLPRLVLYLTFFSRSIASCHRSHPFESTTRSQALDTSQPFAAQFPSDIARSQ